MIPHKIHQVWVGPKPVPEGWSDAWRQMHPTWEYRLWREDDLADFPMLNRAAYEYYRDKRNWVGMSDIARMAILRQFGGVYVDIDSKPLQSFDGAPFMSSRFFAGYEPVPSLPGRVAVGTVGAEAGHHIFDTLAYLIDQMPNIDEVWDTVDGTALTAALLVHRQCCQPLVLPPRTFYPTDAHGRRVAGSEKPYCEHYWATTNGTYPSRTAILVPRRADGGRRDRLWSFVREWWARMGWPIFEGHHEEGRFNASAARNEAARLAGDWDVAVFVDADTIMFDFEPVRRGVEQASKTGRMIRPYSRYLMTNEETADAIIETGKRQAGSYRVLREAAHGGVNIVPRSLWDNVGGYDERFKGWGSEDAAFELACTVLGGFSRIPGEVVHLWHPISADRNTSDPGFIANVALRHRYEAARRPGAMRALLEERTGKPPAAPTIGLVIITDGRRDCIARTIPSLEEKVGPFNARLVCDDSGDPEYAEWLKATFPRYEVRSHRRLGHAGAVRFAMGEAAKLDVDWIFWSEDDYEFTERIDLGRMVATMETEGEHLKQMSLKRQAWFPAEVEAGPSVIDRYDPSLFVEHSDNGSTWLEHRLFFTLNPHLARRSLVSVIRWPLRSNSEHHFGRQLFRDRRVKCGIWGSRSDPPIAIHSGERAGTGY